MDMSSIFINAQPAINASTGQPFKPAFSVLDTGTAFIQAPDHDSARDIYAQISPQIQLIDPAGAWGAPCAVLDAVAADLTFTFGPPGGHQSNFTVPKGFFNLGPYPGLNDTCQALFNSIPPPHRSYDYAENRAVWVIGSPLIKAYYTAWD